MKKLWCLVTILFLFGCNGETTEMSRALSLREKLIQSECCSFDAKVTADFGDKIYTFDLSCSSDQNGNLNFSVISPESISGIGGVISKDGGKITFDEDRAIAFPLLAEGELTPISAPWVLYTTLRSGYLTSCGREGDAIRVTLNDSYEDEALQVDVWLNEADLPETAEIFWQGRRILTIQLANFQIV